jgi:hypothetical protein
VDIVPRPEQQPGHCIATLKSEDPEGFLDTGLVPAVVDPRVYVSVSWLKECAVKLGYVPAEDLEQANRRIALLLEQVAEADKFAEAAEYTLGRFGQQVRNKPGRKPTKAA